MAALVQIMAWCQTSEKPLSEAMMVCFTHAYMRHSPSIELKSQQLGIHYMLIHWRYPKGPFKSGNSCCFMADIQHILWYWWTVVYGDVFFLSSLAEQSTLAPTHSGDNQHCYNSTTPEYETDIYPHDQRKNRACFLSVVEQGLNERKLYICSIFSLCQSPKKKTQINTLWPSDAIWWHKSGSTLAQVMACHLMQCCPQASAAGNIAKYCHVTRRLLSQ